MSDRDTDMQGCITPSFTRDDDVALGAPGNSTTLGSGADPELVRDGARDSLCCSLCVGPIRGRRRNGFCSDKCRMAAKRAAAAAFTGELLGDFRRVVAQVEAELLRRAAPAKRDRT